MRLKGCGRGCVCTGRPLQNKGRKSLSQTKQESACERQRKLENTLLRELGQQDSRCVVPVIVDRLSQACRTCSSADFRGSFAGVEPALLDGMPACRKECGRWFRDSWERHALCSVQAIKPDDASCIVCTGSFCVAAVARTLELTDFREVTKPEVWDSDAEWKT